MGIQSPSWRKILFSNYAFNPSVTLINNFGAIYGQKFEKMDYHRLLGETLRAYATGAPQPIC